MSRPEVDETGTSNPPHEVFSQQAVDVLVDCHLRVIGPLKTKSTVWHVADLSVMALSAHTIKAFDSDQQDLSRALKEMGGLAESLVVDAIKALTSGDRETARQVVAADFAIDAMQGVINEKVVETIARRQPVAVDLRELLGILRIATELER